MKKLSILSGGVIAAAGAQAHEAPYLSDLAHTAAHGGGSPLVPLLGAAVMVGLIALGRRFFFRD